MGFTDVVTTSNPDGAIHYELKVECGKTRPEGEGV